MMRFLCATRPLLSRVPAFDCYRVLGVGRSATPVQIKTAYRALAKQHHPDLNGGKSSARFIEIQTAYDTLMERREEHDRMHGDFGDRKSDPADDRKSQSSWTTHRGRSWWSEQDEASPDFEELWRRMRNRKSEEDEFQDERRNGRKNPRKKNRFSTETRKNADPHSKPALLTVESKGGTHIDWLIGNFIRISDFNGQAAYYQKTGDAKKFPVFLFYSRKFGDWKFHKALKDEDTCLAFNEDGQKFPTNLRSPWFVHRRGRWERLRLEIRGERSDEQTMREEISKWTVDELKKYLEESGQSEQAAQCVEKNDLIDLVLALMTNKQTSGKMADVEIASTAHVGSAAEFPTPSLSRKCRVHGNRVENFKGTVDEVADWILKHGNRLRYYGVFEDKKFRFGLVWADNKEWQRVLFQQVRKPLKDQD